MEAEVTRIGILDIQICVPEKWTDAEAIQFAESKNPCGTTLGWVIRKEGDKNLLGKPERNPCSERVGFVHITLDA